MVELGSNSDLSLTMSPHSNLKRLFSLFWSPVSFAYLPSDFILYVCVSFSHLDCKLFKAKVYKCFVLSPAGCLTKSWWTPISWSVALDGWMVGGWVYGSVAGALFVSRFGNSRQFSGIPEVPMAPAENLGHFHKTEQEAENLGEVLWQ